jgi:hypothetical protein
MQLIGLQNLSARLQIATRKLRLDDGEFRLREAFGKGPGDNARATVPRPDFWRMCSGLISASGKDDPRYA